MVLINPISLYSLYAFHRTQEWFISISQYLILDIQLLLIYVAVEYTTRWIIVLRHAFQKCYIHEGERHKAVLTGSSSTHRSPLPKVWKGTVGDWRIGRIPQQSISDKHKLELSQQPTEGCCIRLFRQTGHSGTNYIGTNTEAQVMQVLYSLYYTHLHYT